MHLYPRHPGTRKQAITSNRTTTANAATTMIRARPHGPDRTSCTIHWKRTFPILLAQFDDVALKMIDVRFARELPIGSLILILLNDWFHSGETVVIVNYHVRETNTSRPIGAWKARKLLSSIRSRSASCTIHLSNAQFTIVKTSGVNRRARDSSVSVLLEEGRSHKDVFWTVSNCFSRLIRRRSVGARHSCTMNTTYGWYRPN